MKKIYLFIILALVPLISMCSGPCGLMRDGYGGYGMGPGMMGGYGYGYGGMFMGILFLILAGVAIYFIVINILFPHRLLAGHLHLLFQKRSRPS